VLLPAAAKLARGAKDKEHPVSDTQYRDRRDRIDIGKNSFHVVATMRAAHRAAAKVVRGQVERGCQYTALSDRHGSLRGHIT